MSFKKTAFLCSLIVFSQPIKSATTATAQDVPYRVPGLSASVPSIVGEVVKNFTDGLNDREKPAKPAQQCVLLHGRAGAGKTTLAQAVAAATKSTLIQVKASGVVNKNQGSGAENIQQAFEEAKQKLFQKVAKSIVLFVDEIHALSATDIPDTRHDTRMGHDHLMQYITDNERERRLLIFFATTYKLEDIQTTLLSRCTKIELPYPCFQQRVDILKARFSYHSKPRFLAHELDDCVKRLAPQQTEAEKTESLKKLDALGMSPADIAGKFSLIQKTEVLHKTTRQKYQALNDKLIVFESKVREFDSVTNDRIQRDAIAQEASALIQECNALKDDVKVLYATAYKDDSEKAAACEDEITEHNAISIGYLNAVKACLNKEKYHYLSEAQLTQLAQDTDGLSPRILIALVDSICSATQRTKERVITEAIIQAELKKAKDAAALEVQKENEKKAEEKAKKDREKGGDLLQREQLKGALRNNASKPHIVDGVPTIIGRAPLTGTEQHPPLKQVLDKAQPGSDEEKAREFLYPTAITQPAELSNLSKFVKAKDFFTKEQKINPQLVFAIGRTTSIETLVNFRNKVKNYLQKARNQGFGIRKTLFMPQVFDKRFSADTHRKLVQIKKIINLRIIELQKTTPKPAQ